MVEKKNTRWGYSWEFSLERRLEREARVRLCNFCGTSFDTPDGLTGPLGFRKCKSCASASEAKK